MSACEISMNHPVFDRVHRLAVELQSNHNEEKFELCESIAAILNNISQEEEGLLSVPVRDEDAILFRKTLRDIFQSKLSCEIRRKALNLAAALFQCYGASWLNDTSPDTHILITLMTNLAAIEIRVALAKKKNFRDVEAQVPTPSLCAWLKIVHGSINRLANDDPDTRWEPEKILSLQRCYMQTCGEVTHFVNRVLVDDDIEANTDLREFVHAAVNTITCWALNDFETLEDVVTPFLVKVAPICPRLRWAQPCLNILARLDHEATINSSEGSKLISQLWDGNEELMQFSLQTFCAELPKMKASQDHRLINTAHFLFSEFDSLIVPNTRNVQEAISKTLAEWMIKKAQFKIYDAQALMHLACLNIKLSQVLWVFCGFHKNNRSNRFKMPSIYKQQSDEVQSLLMESWCEATQVLAQMVRKNRFIAQFLYEHRIVHRAITVPLLGTIEMPEPMESVLQEFHQAVVTAYPEGKETLDQLQENLLTGESYNEV
ncbi:uncharacterized protein LOC111271049 isoform X2 [Varroa jacobsoni]|uniref:Uncharacterized protein n=1 Tax=Varroa destructor TaxID=109461 RepID=A0A7M7K4K8_VARDE|nr:uncharacterized protein LOC111250044 isoform X2 [Varroa destructor]XP_022707334.1 uncharacterized protein LOC111271049 isoform X2 [Varroa jacobsoni]